MIKKSSRAKKMQRIKEEPMRNRRGTDEEPMRNRRGTDEEPTRNRRGTDEEPTRSKGLYHMKKRTRPVPFVAILGILLVLHSALALKGQESWGISPALFCLVLGVALCVLSPLTKGEKESGLTAVAIKKLGMFVVTLAFYTLLFGKVNFVLLTGALLFLLSAITAKKSVTDSLIYSVAVSFAVYFIFSVAFGIRL